VVEVGDVEGAAAQDDGANLKEASSDAFKRCWMRLGLGLHLWSGDDYFLDKQLDANAYKDNRQVIKTGTGAVTIYEPDDPERPFEEDDPQRPFGDSDE